MPEDPGDDGGGLWSAVAWLVVAVGVMTLTIVGLVALTVG